MRHRQMVQTQITRRAAIELDDDFRGGLSRWTGSAGWASSWSFDGTGTAHCGKLALFEPSLSLTDYRVEFMGQIEKLAIAWVFRASDRNNYYATKLVVTGRGPVQGLSLLRYAVIKGHQRMKVQLPLPMLPGGKSMHRIRQEIRGTQFTTFLDGRLIDTWSDTSLARGGAGFFSDSGEVAYLRCVTIADQDDTLGRICAWLAPLLR